MSTATALAKALGARRSGRGWLAKCPAHDDSNPSLSISRADNGKILVHCHAGCSQDAVIDALRACRLWPDNREWIEPRRYQVPKQQHDDDARTLALINRIWTEAADPAGTIAEQYLHARRLFLPPELRVCALRFHPACVWENSTAPCLIAAFRSIADNKLTGITRIRLNQPERWPRVERKMLGHVAGSAIKLDPVGDHLVIGEGLETSLAARQLGLCPVWALGSASGIENLAPIESVKELTIIGENDNGRNQTAAEKCRDNWKQSRVLLMTPRWGKDLNDYLLGHGYDFAA